MIRAGCLALLLAGPAAAEGLAGQALCSAAWDRLSASLSDAATVSSGLVRQDGDWCLASAAVVDLQGQYLPDWHMDRLRFRGAALGWFVDGSTLPEGLEIAVEGLRLVVQTGDARMDWLFKAQSRPNRIDAEIALAWDAQARVLRLEGMTIDFPGENLIEASGVVTGVDLSSTGAMQMSATGFALTEFDTRITTHGLFEWYALMALGPIVLPPDGDMDAAADAIRTDLIEAVVSLPETTVSPASKDALLAMIVEIPNPSGEMTLSLRANPGIGPARVAGYAVTGVPETLADAAPLFQGVVLDVDWTHAEAP